MVSRLGSVTARHYSSGRQPNFAALNRERHLYSTGRPSRLASDHILVAIGFWISMGYNFGCMIASVTSGGFSASSYPMKTADSECLRVVAMATIFRTKIAIALCER